MDTLSSYVIDYEVQKANLDRKQVQSFITCCWALTNYLEFDKAKALLCKLDSIIESVGHSEFAELVDGKGKSQLKLTFEQMKNLE